MNKKPKTKDLPYEDQDRKPIPIDGLECAHCHKTNIFEMIRSYKGERVLKCYGCGRSWAEVVA